jgi:hypothetical protein
MATNALNPQVFFPFLPDYATWDEWNGELAIYYGQRNIEFEPEENWRDGAMNIVQSETFGVYPVPDPYTFATWQDWALEFTTIINGPSR